MSVYDGLINKTMYLSIIGLGYVGLPIAVAFSKKIQVIGYDFNNEKISLYKKNIDPTNEVGSEELKKSSVIFTSNDNDLGKSRFHIVAVPTPINEDKTPDLTPLISATETLAKNLVIGSYVVFESTVYPGVTEEICIPILEKKSGLKAGKDFKVGYSPERINPGDQIHRLETIVKVVSGMDEESLNEIAKVYELVVEAGVYKASSIKVAESAKVIENAQRDINIAFMNELSIIFNKLSIDTKSVLEAASTKWNFLSFKPGLVGGHCIGVDPYYLTYKASQAGYDSKIILAGRKINDDMGQYVVNQLIKTMIKNGINVSEAKVGILGFTFKENCPDTRNTKVIDIVNGLDDYGIKNFIVDPIADHEEAKKEYNISLSSETELRELDALIIAVSHEEFTSWKNKLNKFFKANKINIIFDLKSIYNFEDFNGKNQLYWRL